MTINWSYIIMSAKSLQEKWNFIKIFQQPHQLISKCLSNLWGDLKKPRHNSEKKILRIMKNETFVWKFPRMSTSNCCREVSFTCFWMRFSVIDRETCQEAQCAIKRKFFENKISRKLGKTKTFIFENFRKCQLQNAAERWAVRVFESVFGDRQRNMSGSPMCHKMEIFLKQNFEKIGKNEIFYFWKFSGMSNSKCRREVSFGCLWWILLVFLLNGASDHFVSFLRTKGRLHHSSSQNVSYSKTVTFLKIPSFFILLPLHCYSRNRTIGSISLMQSLGQSFCRNLSELFVYTRNKWVSSKGLEFIPPAANQRHPPLSMVFGDQYRNMSRSSLCHKMKILSLGSSHRITISKLFCRITPKGRTKRIIGGRGLQDHWKCQL